jgi:hypothetical protein
VVEWLMAPGCKPGGLRLYEGSNPSPSTIRNNSEIVRLLEDSRRVAGRPFAGRLFMGGRSAMVAH